MLQINLHLKHLRHLYHLIFLPAFFLSFLHSQSFASEPNLQQVTLLLNWKHQYEFAGYYAAKEKGYYKGAGLEVIIREFEHGTDVVEEVLSGNVKFGTFYSELILASMEGKPVSVLANFFKYSPEVLVTRPDIRLPIDLKGKRVMGGEHELRGANLGAMFRQFNVSPDDFTIVPHTFNIDLFSSGKVDAMTVFLTNEIYHLNKNNIDYNILSPFSFGIPSYDGNLFTSAQTASTQPDMVRKFRDASIRGWLYAVEHPDELIDLIIEKYSQKKSRKALKFEAIEIRKAMLDKSFPIGSINQDMLLSIVATYKELGLVSQNAELDNFIFESFEKRAVSFSQAEKTYLAEKKAIRFCVDPNWMPFEEIDSNGELIGMSADFIPMIQTQVGVPFELVPTETWQQSLDFLKEKRCDIISMAMQTKEREKHFNFTRPYLEFSEVIITRKAELFIEDLAKMLDRRHGIVQGYSRKELLKREYPGIEIQDVASVEDGLRQVQAGKLFSFIGNAAAITYAIQREDLTELKISGKLAQSHKLSIAVRNDEPILQTILDNVVSTINEKETQDIYKKWANVKYLHQVDYTLLWKILAVVAVLFTLGIHKNRQLAKLNSQIKDVNRELQQEVRERVEAEKKKGELEKQLYQAHKMESIGLMAGGVAHDLNNILAGVIGYPELLLKDLPEDSKLRRPIEAIRESGQRAAVVVADLLTVARGVAITRENHDINILIEKYLNSPEYRKLKSLHPNIIYQQLFESTNSTISCSSVHVQKCLMNLVTNGCEAIADTGIISISTYNQHIDKKTTVDQEIEVGEYVVLSVHDTGSGVSKNDLKHIFEPFYTRKMMGRSGSGLGLAVVWNTMEDHAGKVFVESGEKGTYFKLYFPVSQRDNVSPINDDYQGNLLGRNEHILVVDDETQLRDIARQMLTNLGYRVDVVESGESAIEFVREKSVDLLLLDMLMEPGISGRQTYKEITKLYPDQKAIVVSGFSESTDVKATLQQGASGFITKPYSMNQLGRAVKEALQS